MAHEYQASNDQVAQLRHLLSEEDRETCDDATLDRFVRADKGNLKAAATRLTATMKWRRETCPEALTCQCCAKDPRSHYFHPVGFTLSGQPVLYSCNALASDRSAAGNRAHMIQTFEQAVRLMPQGVERWVWFADLGGFGVRDLAPGLAQQFLDLAGRYYPERLGTFYLVAAPSVFSVLWNAINPLIDQTTRAKIKLLPYDVQKSDGKLRAEVESKFEATCAAWVLEEMSDNRRKEQLKSKQYDREAFAQALHGNDHMQSHWGCKDLLDRLREKPELLKM